MEPPEPEPVPPLRDVGAAEGNAEPVAGPFGQPVSRVLIDLGTPVDDLVPADGSLTAADVVQRDLAAVGKVCPIRIKVLSKIIDAAGLRFDRAEVARALRERLSAIAHRLIDRGVDRTMDDAKVRDLFRVLAVPAVEHQLRAGLVSALRIVAVHEVRKLDEAPRRDDLHERLTGLQRDTDRARDRGRKAEVARIEDQMSSIEAQLAAIPKYDPARHRRCARLAALVDHPLRGATARAAVMYLPPGKPGPVAPELAALTPDEVVEITDYKVPNAVYKAASGIRAELAGLDEIEPTVAPATPGEVWTSPV